MQTNPAVEHNINIIIVLSVYCLVLLFSSSFNCVLLYDIHFN